MILASQWRGEDLSMKRIPMLIIMLAMIAVTATACNSNTASTGKQNSTANIKANIVLGDKITINGKGAELTDNGITITEAGTYNISGTLKDGIVQVEAPEGTVNLVLDNVNIANSAGPAVFFSEIGEAIITLKDGTENTLTDGGKSDNDAAIYSNATLTIKGGGALNVNGKNAEGISSTMHINIESGNIHVIAVEDGLNANNNNVSAITVNSGYLYIQSETGNGINSKGTININGGTVIAMASLTDAGGGLNADGDVIINGGTVIATGAKNSLPVAASAQKSILFKFDSTQAAKSTFSVQDEGGAIISFAPAISYQQVLYSSEKLADDITYYIYSGGSVSGDNIDGLYTDASYSGGTLVSSVTTDSISSGSPGPGEPGGNMPNGTPPEGEGQEPPADMQNPPADRPEPPTDMQTPPADRPEPPTGMTQQQ